jgi:predicted AlkP superfamily pyrophosphatase or phosphodiesterase|tara:strand:+ start:439 stop:1284 length:846 start_codon:yes stop_codon:yes gene_type:complete
MENKVILLILDGLGYSYARRLMGNLEGWVASGEANLWKGQSVLPSVSGPCYASIHTGLTPQDHGVTSNYHQGKLEDADIFSAVKAAGGTTAAIAHSFFSDYFQSSPFQHLQDMEVDDISRPIQHGRFYTMAGENKAQPATPSDIDLFWQMSLLIQRHQPDYFLFHSCTLDSLGHHYGFDSIEIDKNCYTIDAALGDFIPRWQEQGYDVIITADHGQSARGHHGGTEAIMRDIPIYYFANPNHPIQGPSPDHVIAQTALAPSILQRMGIAIPGSMQTKPVWI